MVHSLFLPKNTQRLKALIDSCVPGEGGDPEFAFPIGNLTTPVGREAVLSCTVNNLGKYKVGWLKAEDQTILSLHTRVVTHNSRISVTHDNQRTWRLHIRQLKVSDRGCYMCQINTNIMKKQVGCIDVHVPPDILNDETSADVSIQEGENATLICKAAGHPEPRITWRREDGTHILLRKNARSDMSNPRVYDSRNAKTPSAIKRPMEQLYLPHLKRLNPLYKP
ncbi:hypothetical protein GE061_016392 [Apolygus lucorum]|uniref:Ig-like domain-containing protein n=1 Tax=Apolygus lucorum TaxID=248454 RepID=A0A6A4K793_APOLU|nr:hypothetical protein GE061_016392 [Apolygus lucorum]